MAAHNNIGVCANDSCPIKLECLRWHLGTNKNHRAVWLAGGQNVGTKDCEFFIKYEED